MSLATDLTGEAVKTALNPYRWILYLVLVAALVGGYFYHRAQLIEQGVTTGGANIQAKWDKAVKDAKEAQKTADTKATKEAKVEVEKVKIVYRDRVKKVVEYVPSEAAGPCLADDEFVRLFNDEQTSGISNAPSK